MSAILGNVENLFEMFPAEYGRLDFALKKGGASLPQMPAILKKTGEEWDRLYGNP